MPRIVSDEEIIKALRNLNPNTVEDDDDAERGSGFRQKMDSIFQSSWDRAEPIGDRQFRFVDQVEENITFIGGIKDVRHFDLGKYPITYPISKPHRSGLYAQYTYLKPE